MTKGKGSASKAPGHAAPAEGADNNTRLAFLEAGVSTLAIALAASRNVETIGDSNPFDLALDDIGSKQRLGVEAAKIYDHLSANPAPEGVEEGGSFADIVIRRLEAAAGEIHRQLDRIEAISGAVAAYGIDLAEGLDPVEQAIAIIGRAREVTLGLAEAVIEGGHKIDDEDAFTAACRILKAGPDNATEGEIAAIARADAADKRVAELEAEVGELTTDVEEAISERNQARNELQALNEGREPEAKDEPEAEEPEAVALPPRARPGAARDVGPMFCQADAADIAEIIAAGTAELELAFSNGEYELIEFGPQPIDAAALVYRGRQFHVEPALFVRGGEAREELHGVALIVNGEQFDYCEFAEPQAVEPRSERKLERMIVFG